MVVVRLLSYLSFPFISFHILTFASTSLHFLSLPFDFFHFVPFGFIFFHVHLNPAAAEGSEAPALISGRSEGLGKGHQDCQKCQKSQNLTSP